MAAELLRTISAAGEHHLTAVLLDDQHVEQMRIEVAATIVIAGS